MKDSLNNETPVQYSTWKEFGYWLIQIVKKNDKRTDDLEETQGDHEIRIVKLEEIEKSRPKDLEKRLDKFETSIRTIWTTVIIIVSFIVGAITLILNIIDTLKLDK